MPHNNGRVRCRASHCLGTERSFACSVGTEMSEFNASWLQNPHRENVMKTVSLLAGACALVLPLGTAAAGPCTTEIENLTKLLASRDAGAGPTTGPVGTTTGQHLPTSAMGAADPSTAASAAAAESAKPQHPPTAAMNQATQGGGWITAGGRYRSRATSSDRRYERGHARRCRFAAGCAEPEPRRSHRCATGARRSPARIRPLGFSPKRSRASA